MNLFFSFIQTSFRFFLISDNNDTARMQGHKLQGFKAPWQKLEFRPALDIIGPFPVNHTISVQKNSLRFMYHFSPIIQTP